MFPQGPLHADYAQNPIFQMFMQWFTLPDGTSIMFRNLKEQDTHERYRGFNLYKAIAKYCKDAVPRKQIERFGGSYLFEGKVHASEVLFID